LFPNHPLLLPKNPKDRTRVIEIDNWVSHRFIPNIFRSYPGDGIDLLVNGWKLGHVLNQTCHGGLPPGITKIWPLVVRSLSFIKRMIKMTDTHLSVAAAKEVIYKEFINHLDGGPFLGARDKPTVADIACYPNFLMFYLIGFRHADDILKHPEIINWMHHMRLHLNGATPPLVPSLCVNNEFPTLDTPEPFNSTFFPSISQNYF